MQQDSIVRTKYLPGRERRAENFTNNTTASAGAFNVSVPALLLGAPPVGDTLLVRRTIFGPGAGRQDASINLTSNADGQANELYVRYQALPDTIHFDASFEGHLLPAQTATIPTTQAGTYYILAGASEPGADTPFQLSTNLLPFGIADVQQDSGGDSRYVTVTVTGAAFDKQATLKLIRPQLAEFAGRYQVVNAAKIIATFDTHRCPARPVRRAGDEPGWHDGHRALPLPGRARRSRSI